MHRSVKIALEEVGYLEKQSPLQLDSKLENPGDKNYTRYARDMAAHRWFYRGNKQGQPWCDVFVDWCFVKAYGTRIARKLLRQPILSRGAGCRYSYGYFEKAGQIEKDPLPGDQIFFQEDGIICHTGIVEDVRGGRVYTIEGNTSDEAGIVPNGGCVARKCYDLSNPGIAGYGRPHYEILKRQNGIFR